jgi:hypothetical protein
LFDTIVGMKCPNMAACSLFPIFSNNAFLKIWQINYCEGDYSRCARFAGLCKGAAVPTTLLPNGKHLPVINNPPPDSTK